VSIKSANPTVERNEEHPELKRLGARVEELGLSARSFNCLDRSNIKLIGEIVLMSQNDLKEVKNLGKKSFEEILEKITEFGYAVGQELPADLIASIKKKIEGQ
jgi:DNA-directed RNA polymerase subunit alpha